MISYLFENYFDSKIRIIDKIIHFRNLSHIVYPCTEKNTNAVFKIKLLYIILILNKLCKKQMSNSVIRSELIHKLLSLQIDKNNLVQCIKLIIYINLIKIKNEKINFSEIHFISLCDKRYRDIDCYLCVHTGLGYYCSALEHIAHITLKFNFFFFLK